MFKKILLCSDGSKDALGAARLAAAISHAFGSDLIALDVFHFEYGALDAGIMGVDQGVIELLARDQTEAAERNLRPIFDSRHVAGTVRQVRGRPTDAILEVAEEEKAELILIGSRGLRGAADLLLGSVSMGVLNHAHCSVLIARGRNLPSGTDGFHRILLASDDSSGARKAASAAVAIARKFSTGLTVLNVCPDFASVRLPGDRFVPVMSGEADAYASEKLKAVQDSVGAIADGAGVACTYRQEVGHTDEVLLRFAETEGSDLIVLGSRGLDGFERALLGSVSHHVAHRATGPVLVVR